MQPARIGIIGCGAISPLYFQAGRRFDAIELAACADLYPEKACEKAHEFGLDACESVEELLDRDDVEIVLNLTIPAVHADISLAALNSGKSVYSEKPLALSPREGKQLIDLARAKNLRIGCAPDTFLGGAHQTARKLIDEGAIGQPVGAAAFMLCPGHERWHPNPEFYYKPGAGPLFDMGPYYVTALINMLGPVRRVTGSARITHPERLITSQPLSGTKIKVETPTHVSGVLDFESGAVGTITTSFDVWAAELPWIEVYGSEGTLSVPDPNGFGGRLRIRKARSEQWHEEAHTHEYSEQSRGLGVADMAAAMRSGREHRASGELALHVLEVMHGILRASEEGRHIAMENPCPAPKPMPTELRNGEVEP